jgi:hypothetical protein
VQIANWGRFDFGQLASANLGLFHPGRSLRRRGTGVSSYSRSQTTAFLTAFVVLFPSGFRSA